MHYSIQALHTLSISTASVSEIFSCLNVLPSFILEDIATIMMQEGRLSTRSFLAALRATIPYVCEHLQYICYLDTLVVKRRIDDERQPELGGLK
jgi:hypothetical protein